MKFYRKKGRTPMKPWTADVDMSRVSVSESDKENGSPRVGDMIAWNENDPTDQWLVAGDYFRKNYEEDV